MSDERRLIPLSEARQKAGRSTKAPPPRRDDDRPLIRIRVGDLAGMVNELEAALITADLGIYQRGNALVTTGIAPVITADRKEVGSHQIIAIGDHALLEAAMAAAQFEKFDGRAGGMVSANCPMTIIKALEQRSGRYRFPILAGIVNAPTLRADGSILRHPGYDEATGLLFDPAGAVFPPVLDRPSRGQAEAGLKVLNELIDTFPFVGDADRSVALSAILTACVPEITPNGTASRLHGAGCRLWQVEACRHRQHHRHGPRGWRGRHGRRPGRTRKTARVAAVERIRDRNRQRRGQPRIRLPLPDPHSIDGASSYPRQVRNARVADQRPGDGNGQQSRALR